MPNSTGALYPSTGNREDLLDVLTVVDAKNTPISSSIARTGADITNPGVYSYLADSYNDPDTSGVLTAADVTEFDDPTKNRVLLSARAQKFRRTIKVDDFQANLADVAAVGRKKEMARGTARALVELKRDVESAISSDNDSQEQAGQAPYKTRGLGKWIQATAQTDLPVPASQLTPSGSISTTATASLTETDVQALLQSIYEETGTIDSLTLVCGPALKRAFTNFTRFTVNSTANTFSLRSTDQSAANRTLTTAVDFYNGDFSNVALVPSLYLANGEAEAVRFARGYVINPEHIMLRYGRRPRFQELEDQGGGPRGLVDCIVSLACLSPKGLGKFAATS